MKFQRKLKPSINVNLIPMIDVVFQLVVFFMVSSTFIVTPGIGLTFPAAATSEPVTMSRLVITVASGDEIYLNREKLDIRELDEKLALLREQAAGSGIDEAGTAAGGTIQTVVLEGDRKISYELMIEVLDVLRKNGYSAVNLKTRELSNSQFDEPR